MSEQHRDHVGPVLEAGDDAQAVITAIRQANEAVVVESRGSYHRVLVPHRCEVTGQAIERILGRPFTLPGDLEAIMPSFKGRFTVSDDKAVWAFR
jgi:MmoB/DmpM family